MTPKKKWLDIASQLTLALTVVLFAVAAVEHGFTHDLLLEAAVFLISLKLVISGQKIETMIRGLQEKLDSIERKAPRD